MSILETLKKQGIAVKGEAESLKLAEHLEAAAKILRGGATANKAHDAFWEQRKNGKSKYAKVNDFFENGRQGFIKSQEGDLKRFGWTLLKSTKDERVFCIPGRADYKLSIKEGKFSVNRNHEVVIAPTHERDLQEWLKKFKSVAKI